MPENLLLILLVLDYMCHCYLRSDGLGAVMVTDKEYPARVAFGLETRLLDEFDSKFVYAAFWLMEMKLVVVGRTPRSTTSLSCPVSTRPFRNIKYVVGSEFMP